MSRTTPAAVQAVLGGSTPNSHYDGTTDLSPFIDTASSFVDTVATKPPVQTAAALELIERWLAAHCYTAYDQLFANKTTGKASASFQDSSGGSGFAGTAYGRMAMLLDTTGYLRALNSKGVVGMAWLGTQPSVQPQVQSNGDVS